MQEEEEGEEEAGLVLSKGSDENKCVNISGCRRRQCQHVLEQAGRENLGRRTHCLGGTPVQWMEQGARMSQTFLAPDKLETKKGGERRVYSLEHSLETSW